MHEPSLNFLRTLVNTPSPTGHEVRGQRVWLDYAKQFADETFSDAYGNCVRGEHDARRTALVQHGDAIAVGVGKRFVGELFGVIEPDALAADFVAGGTRRVDERA